MRSYSTPSTSMYRCMPTCTSFGARCVRDGSVNDAPSKPPTQSQVVAVGLLLVVFAGSPVVRYVCVMRLFVYAWVCPPVVARGFIALVLLRLHGLACAV